jgi:hypothetical protein
LIVADKNVYTQVRNAIEILSFLKSGIGQFINYYTLSFYHRDRIECIYFSKIYCPHQAYRVEVFVFQFQSPVQCPFAKRSPTRRHLLFWSGDQELAIITRFVTISRYLIQLWPKINSKLETFFFSSRTL